MSLSKKFLIILVLIVILPFGIGSIVTYRLAYTSLKSQIVQLNNSLYGKGVDRFQQQMEVILEMPTAIYIEGNAEVLDALRSTDPYMPSTEEQIRGILRDCMVSAEGVLGIVVRGANNEMLEELKYSTGNRWRANVRSEGKNADGFRILEVDGSPNVVIYRKTLIDYPAQNELAVFEVCFELSYLQELCRGLTFTDEYADFLIEISDGILLYLPSGSENFTEGLSDAEAAGLKWGVWPQDGIVFSKEFSKAGESFGVYKIVPDSSISRPARRVVQRVMIVEVILLLLIMVAFLCIYRDIIRPIRRMALNMREVERGVYSYHAEASTEDEIAQLDHQYEEMVNSLNVLINKDIRNELELSQARLNALQAQINPHFLNNVLQSIATQALCEGAEGVNESLSWLGRFFQYTMELKQKTVSLEEEYQHINYYLLLMQQRYHDKLDWNLDLKPELTQVQVPKMILQPLVENAIKHGAIRTGARCLIRVETISDGDWIRIVVADNGPGFSGEMLASMEERYEQYQQQRQSDGHGIGFFNVLERLKIYTDNQYSWEVLQEDGENRIILSLPDRR